MAAIFTTKASAEAYRAKVEQAEGLPRIEGAHFGLGRHEPLSFSPTTHLADIVAHPDGKQFAYPIVSEKVPLPDKEADLDDTWKPKEAPMVLDEGWPDE